MSSSAIVNSECESLNNQAHIDDYYVDDNDPDELWGDHVDAPAEPDGDD